MIENPRDLYELTTSYEEIVKQKADHIKRIIGPGSVRTDEARQVLSSIEDIIDKIDELWEGVEEG